MQIFEVHDARLMMILSCLPRVLSALFFFELYIFLVYCESLNKNEKKTDYLNISVYLYNFHMYSSNLFSSKLPIKLYLYLYIVCEVNYTLNVKKKRIKSAFGTCSSVFCVFLHILILCNRLIPPILCFFCTIYNESTNTSYKTQTLKGTMIWNFEYEW